MSNNGKGGHTNRNSEADRKRIFENVANKTIFDAVGVAFEREDEAGKTDAGKI